VELHGVSYLILNKNLHQSPIAELNWYKHLLNSCHLELIEQRVKYFLKIHLFSSDCILLPEKNHKPVFRIKWHEKVLRCTYVLMRHLSVIMLKSECMNSSHNSYSHLQSTLSNPACKLSILDMFLVSRLAAPVLLSLNQYTRAKVRISGATAPTSLHTLWIHSFPTIKMTRNHLSS
jgi:hypothetical protein